MTDFSTNSLAQGSRGLRNNNPGNIAPGGLIPWQGQIGDDGVDVTFDTVENGIRAMAIILCNYQIIHGLYTLNDIFARWAPASDGNNPTEYANYVAGQLGISPTDSFTITADNIVPLMQAICNMELGSYSQYVTNQMLTDGANSTTAAILEFLGTTTGKFSVAAVIGLIVMVFYLFKKK